MFTICRAFRRFHICTYLYIPPEHGTYEIVQRKDLSHASSVAHSVKNRFQTDCRSQPAASHSSIRVPGAIVRLGNGQLGARGPRQLDTAERSGRRPLDGSISCPSGKRAGCQGENGLAWWLSKFRRATHGETTDGNDPAATGTIRAAIGDVAQEPHSWRAHPQTVVEGGC